MVELIEKSAFSDGGLPVEAGAARLEEVPFRPMFSLAIYDGQEAAAAKKLGGKLPAAGEMVKAGKAALCWGGMKLYFWFGEAPDLDGVAAVTDQSDGWVTLRLTGDDAAAVMARICPLDLRDFGPGKVARTELAHMMAMVIAIEDGFELMLMRSFARWGAHHIEEAMYSIAGQRALEK